MSDASLNDALDFTDSLEQSLLSESDFDLLSGDGDSVFEITPDSLHGGYVMWQSVVQAFNDLLAQL
jgi:hypothetical protein